MGILCYFFMISAFFWLNVTCFDLWMSIRGIRYELQSSSPRLRFIYYSIYVWSAATIFTVTATYIEHTNINDAWKPGFGNGQCFIKSRDWSALLYFQGPSGLLNLFNVFFFIMSVINVYQIQEDSYELKKETSQQYKVSTFLRLFLVMGVSWILEIFTYLFAKNNSFIIVIFNMMNASQGIILFIVLVLKRRVLTLLKKQWTKNT
uniref:G-protein coupled receptor Mth n=2 Tax=Zeugodacus cucurbitae TaxID=28588 RepID=A0A0A1X956_ZEUCU